MTRPAPGDVVAGRNAVLEALRAGVPAHTLYLTGARDDRIDEAVRLATSRGVPVEQVSKAELDRRAAGTAHQGLALGVPPYPYLHPDDLLERASGEPPLLVALDGVTDPHNLGAVLRSAAAFGAHGVLVPERRSAGVTPAVWKASAGGAAVVPVARATNLPRALRSYADAGLTICGLAADGADPLPAGLDELALGPLALVLGGEGRGLSRLVLEACEQTVRIPIAAGMESLNVSVAAALALFVVALRKGSVTTQGRRVL